jgi:hypothetical protein
VLRLTRRSLVLGAAVTAGAAVLRPRRAFATTTTWNPSDLAIGRVVLSGANLVATGIDTPYLAIAVDIGNNKLWAYNPVTGKWNNDVIANQNPATGTGGFSISGITSGGAIYPGFSGYNGGAQDQCTINGGNSASFVYSVPSGFTAWDTLAGATTTWDSGHKGSGIVLSGGNLIATATTATTFQSVLGTQGLTSGKGYFELLANVVDGANGFMIGIGNISTNTASYLGANSNSGGLQSQGSGYNLSGGNGSWPWSNAWVRGVRATTSKSSGKWVFEVTVTSKDALNGWMCGLGAAAWPLGTAQMGDTHSIGMQTGGGTANIYYNTTSAVAGFVITAGSVIMVAVDLGANKAWFYNPISAAWQGGMSPDPASGAGGIDISYIGAAVFPAWQGFEPSGDVGTLNTGGSSFTNTVPSGFTAWDGTPVGSSGGNLLLLGVGN